MQLPYSAVFSRNACLQQTVVHLLLHMYLLHVFLTIVNMAKYMYMYLHSKVHLATTRLNVPSCRQ